MKNLIISLILICLSSVAHARDTEDSYAKKWCKLYSGEYQKILTDGSKPDCVLEDAVVELKILDKAAKVYDSVGQALHYAVVAKKHPQIVYVIEKPEQKMYLERIKAMIAEYKLPIILTEYSTKKPETPLSQIEEEAKIEELTLSPQEEAAATKAKAEMAPDLEIKMKSDPTAAPAAAESDSEEMKDALPGAQVDVAIQLKKIASEAPAKVCKKHCSKKKACGDECIKKDRACTKPAGSACDT